MFWRDIEKIGSGNTRPRVGDTCFKVSVSRFETGEMLFAGVTRVSGLETRVREFESRVPGCPGGLSGSETRVWDPRSRVSSG
jgi:hypothetical protein